MQIMKNIDKSIKSYSIEGLEALVKDLKQPRFRAKQITKWLYGEGVSSYDEMTNLPKALREALTARHPLYAPNIVNRQTSKDGTRKYILEYADDQRVETVAIPSGSAEPAEHVTVCLSTQVGCAMGCSFCATGKEGFSRNLLPGEIVDQILVVQADMQKRVSNLVTMGQGEPFLNYENTLAALRFANNTECLNIGARRITLSSCGILSGIYQLSKEPEQFTLAISLHSALQDVRDSLMPKSALSLLPQLKTALSDYLKVTNRRVTLEYIMIDQINDTPEAFKALLDFCSGLLCHVNLIPTNPIKGSPFKPSSPKTIKMWVAALEKNYIPTSVRNSRGSDIAGACGQLKNSL